MYQCTRCGSPADPIGGCSECGQQAPPLAVEIDRISREIADMSARDLAIQRERANLSARMQAALHQRNLLSGAQSERLRQAPKQRSSVRRRMALLPTSMGWDPRDAPPEATGSLARTAPLAHTALDGTAPPARTTPLGGPPGRPGRVSATTATGAPIVAPLDETEDGPQPEASSRSVQNILLILGGLLIGLAAAVFIAVATTVLDEVSRAAILVLTTVLVLLVPPFLTRRGLTSTAETLTTVGLALVPLAGYAFWVIGSLRVALGLPITIFGGLVLAGTAAVAVGYRAMTGLTAPRFAAVAAMQPVVPLLAYGWVTGPAGWALVFTIVAALDVGVALLIDRSAQPTARWLRELVWVSHGAALGAGLIYSVVALATADPVGAAVRAAAVLLLAAAVGLVGAWTLRHAPMPDVAAGIMTLAVTGSAARVAAVALPGRALVLIAGAVAVAGLGVRALPGTARRGPQLAASAALAVLGVIVTAASLRAAVAPVGAVFPVWRADLGGYPERLAAGVGPAGWQLFVAAALLTLAAALAVPAAFQREATVAGAAVTALAAPASLGAGWGTTPWLLFIAAVGLGAAGLGSPTLRATRVHLGAALLVGLASAATSLARPDLTAGVLTALTLAGGVIGLAPRWAGGLPAGLPGGQSPPAGPTRPTGQHAETSRPAGLPAGQNPPAGPTRLTGPHAETITEAALGGAVAALPGAAAASVVAWLPGADAVPVLGASFLAGSVALGFAALFGVAHRRTSPPLALGGTVGAVAVTIAAFGGHGATIADLLIALSLLVGALLLWFAPALDAGRANRRIVGTDVAAAAVTAAAIGALARVVGAVLPGTGLVTTAALVLAVAVGVRAMPPDWRPGPVLGCAIAGGVVATLAAYAAAVGGLRVLMATSPVWAAELGDWATTVDAGRLYGGQAPVALLLLAVAGAVALPPRFRAVVVPAAVGLAVIGAPAALGLAWWTPILLGLLGAGAFGLAGVWTRSPRAGVARGAVAGALATFAVGASLVGSWATAGALFGVAAVAMLTVAAARLATVTRANEPPETTSHLVPVGGAALTAALLALPGAMAALAVALHRPADIALPAAFATTAIGLALVTVAHRHTGDYLTYATAGTAAAATAIAVAVASSTVISDAVAALPTGQPFGVYAAAAALLGVLAELLRVTGARRPAPARTRAGPRWRGLGQPTGEPAERVGAGVLTPGLLAVAGVPTLLAIVSVGPALTTALLEPHRTLRHVWQGPDAAGVDWAGRAFGDGSSVLTALVLTLAFALAAVGFGERAVARRTVAGDAEATRGRRRDELLGQVVPVVIPGVAVTLLIAPYGLHAPWPAGTGAALAVFTIAMLGVALSPPPPATMSSRPLRVTRAVVLAIGLAAGGAGLAGSLATRSMTLFTLGGAVAVGAVAALGGTTRFARVAGWAFASVSANFFAYVLGLALGLAPHWSAFVVLGVSAAVLVTAATLPRLSQPEARGEGAALEWSGYAGALLALALAARSTPHLAALLAAWGAVLGVAAVRLGRPARQRRTLLWAAAGFELVAWWLLASSAEIALPEAYTLPFAGLALIVGIVELRHHPELGSWAAYGPALMATFVPTLAIVLVTDTGPTRRVVLLLAAAGTLIVGSVRRQRAPVVIGGVVTTVAAVHELFLASVWLVLIPVGVALLVLGATNEKRRREMLRLRGALNRMR